MNEHLTDLLAQALSGNADNLIRYCYPHVRAMLRGKVPLNDVDDVSQDVLCKAINGLDQLRGEGEKFLPWLRKLARNKATDFWRERYQHRMESLSTFTDDLKCCQNTYSPDIEVSHNEQLKRLYQAMDSLTEPRRTIMRLYYIDGSTTPEIATKMNMSEVAVRRQMTNARYSLRSQLNGED